MKKSGLIIIMLVLLLVIGALLVVKFGNVSMSLKGSSEVKLNLNDEYNESGVNAKFLFMNVEDKVVTQNNIDTSVPGNYTVSYSYENMFVKKTIERRVIVVDNIPPTLNVEKKSLTMYVDGVLSLPKITASDNIDGNISKSVVVDNQVNNKKAGKYLINVSVKDSSGNEATDSINVTVKAKPVKNGSVNARIDVYISEQKLYYFENNKLILTSDVVTGKKNGTPTGHYKVLRKKQDVYLKGDTFLDHVDYWIAFIGGLYGIHDAQWRNEFGGDIYKKDGSHGCVNMPLNNMKKLYEKVKVGTAVNIYN